MGNFLARRVAISFWRITLFHAISFATKLKSLTGSWSCLRPMQGQMWLSVV